MAKSTSSTQEAVDEKSLEEISQFKQISLGEGAATCQVCGSDVREGARVVAYAFRPAGSPAFEIGHVLCADHQDERFEVYTIGVCELVVAGRVGKCADVTSQSSWPVLLAPEVLAVSGMGSKSLVATDSPGERSTSLQQSTASACEGGQ